MKYYQRFSYFHLCYEQNITSEYTYLSDISFAILFNLEEEVSWKIVSTRICLP